MQKISEVMSTDVQTISPDASIEEAAQEMRDGDFGLLPVGEEDQLLGVITDRDITVRAVARIRARRFVMSCRKASYGRTKMIRWKMRHGL